MAFGVVEAKEAVKNALRDVADFQGEDIEGFTFQDFKPYHVKVFLAALKLNVRKFTEGDDGYYDLPLTKDSVDKWPTIGDLIGWVAQERALRTSSHERLRFDQPGGSR